MSKIDKPFFGPFEILCFYKNERKLKILKFSNEVIEKTKVKINLIIIVHIVMDGTTYIFQESKIVLQSFGVLF